MTASLSQQYHIISCRLTRLIAQKCVLYRRDSSETPPSALMGQLPMERIVPGPVFGKVGVGFVCKSTNHCLFVVYGLGRQNVVLLVRGRHLFLVLIKLKVDIESVRVSIAIIESFSIQKIARHSLYLFSSYFNHFVSVFYP